MKKYIMAAALVMGFAAAANAQENKLVVKPSGRILMDAAFLNSSNKAVDEQCVDGVNVPDIRIGMKVSYGKWEGKADIGYARGSVSPKDIFIQYNFNKQNFLRGGYFVHQFGYQSATSSSFKVSMEEPETHSAFGVGGRLVGLMYEHSDDKFMGTGSVYTDAQSFKKQTNQTGYQGTGFLTRLVYHPLIEKGNLFHVGIGLNYELAAENRSNMEFKAPYPVRVAGINAIGAKITDAKNDFKFSGELMAAKGHVGIEGQYIFMNVDRKGDAKSYNAWGAYGNLRFLLNNEYEYVKNDAGIATPAPKSWELVAAYNYTDMNDAKAGFHGGKLSDWALTMNYYINKYMIWRVSGHIVRAGESDYSGFNKNTFRVIETRLQFKF
ncbi:MAG: porin [Prevotella stercorea]|mgnify:FL=1|jgi:phosphate-selective porin OprO/OprP|uniref:porin n=1 Tax=Leyella stercorea TaxID=363265 RepID=UPI001F32CDC0|nr:porin [Leyella stercorea]MCI5987909.1 OprO/OprP family phosphate-selective porin [Prevotella sp.]MCF2614040.1 ATPase [Leyella stercorea]MCI6132758.1 OprO/OprP family phosphate-selective porin [Prevotella sp.]MCI6341246.1 OprO/OprP family phosphate-selective porin [Prevotella sp.]MCI6489727.1 OprO/OprP family phosphate-selective porin [Prevotella sp.]